MKEGNEGIAGVSCVLEFPAIVRGVDDVGGEWTTGQPGFGQRAWTLQGVGCQRIGEPPVCILSAPTDLGEEAALHRAAQLSPTVRPVIGRRNESIEVTDGFGCSSRSSQQPEGPALHVHLKGAFPASPRHDVECSGQGILSERSY